MTAIAIIIGKKKTQVASDFRINLTFTSRNTQIITSQCDSTRNCKISNTGSTS